MSIMWLRVPNLPITYFPLNIFSVNAVLHKPRSFSEKNDFETGQVIPSHLFYDFECYATGIRAWHMQFKFRDVE